MNNQGYLISPIYSSWFFSKTKNDIIEKDIHININDYNAPVPELFEAQKEREESNDVDDKADQLQEDIENIDKIIEAFNYLAKTRHTAPIVHSSTGQVRARRMMMVWIGVKIYKRQIEPINYC